MSKFIPAILIICYSCNSSMTKISSDNFLPPTIIYKTINDYENNVPITMDSKKEKIVSYPAPSDLFYKGDLALPTMLINDYLLDNRGININSVFTSFTYQEYSKFKNAPNIDTLFNRIIDKNPFIEIYSCGNRSNIKNETRYCNKMIMNKFKECIRIK